MGREFPGVQRLRLLPVTAEDIVSAPGWGPQIPQAMRGRKNVMGRFKGIQVFIGLPCSSDGKESACNAGDLCLIPGLGRSPGEGNSNPLQCSSLENSVDRVAWLAIVHGIAERQTQLSN